MTKRILIIDDNITFQKTMSAELRRASYEVIQAFNGEEGLNKATKENPDLILVDIKMPMMDGITLLKKLRKDTNVRKVPVFITSNVDNIDTISEGVALGIRGYITKSNESLDNILKEINSVFNTDK